MLSFYVLTNPGIVIIPLNISSHNYLALVAVLRYLKSGLYPG